MKTSGTTKEDLLQATLKVVSEKGYLGATTRQIAREAGVTELTLFRHFGSKEKLFEGLLEQHTFLPRLRGLLPELEPLPYEEALRLIATRFLLSLKERNSMVKIISSEINRYPEKIRKVYNNAIDDIRSTLARYFASLRKSGALRQVSPEIAARMFLGMFFSYFRAEEIMQGRDITKNRQMEKHVREFVDIFIHGTLRQGN
jgi:AcrR family transcriptional regulator